MIGRLPIAVTHLHPSLAAPTRLASLREVLGLASQRFVTMPVLTHDWYRSNECECFFEVFDQSIHPESGRNYMYMPKGWQVLWLWGLHAEPCRIACQHRCIDHTGLRAFNPVLITITTKVSRVFKALILVSFGDTPSKNFRA